MARRIRTDDEVIVLAGKDKGKRGRVIRVLPKSQRVVVEGVNQVKRHTRASPGVRQAGIITQEAPIHISNVAYVDSETGEYGRVRFRTLEDGTVVRVVKSGNKS